jgi:hypothetical protein
VYPDVPTIFESPRVTKDNSKLLKYRADVAEFGRVIAISNLVPSDKADHLRQTIDKLLKIPKIVKDTERTTPINYASMEELDLLIKRVNILTTQERLLLNQILYKMY